jgi:enterochelin esterase family protein
MSRLLLCASVLFHGPALAAEFAGFDDFLARYTAAEPARREALASQFVDWQKQHGGFPVTTAAGDVVFVYFAAAGERAVSLTGDFLPGGRSDLYWRLPGESMQARGRIFFARHHFEPDARLDYVYVVDGTRRTDPLNPESIVSGTGHGPASVLSMPAHKRPRELADAGSPKGTVINVDEAWATPKIAVYLPPGYDPAVRYPVLYTADGAAWAELIHLPLILDNLVAAGEIRPIIAVMIDAAEDRGAWYLYNPAYLQYLERVVRYVDGRFATMQAPAFRAHAGTSAGARAALYAGLERPELFGKIALLSPALGDTADPGNYLVPLLRGAGHVPKGMSVWIGAGTYEGVLYDDARALLQRFEETDTGTVHAFGHHGHSFGAWQENAIAVLKHFFPP